MPHDGRRTRVVAIGGRTAVIAHLAAVLAQQKLFVLVPQGEADCRVDDLRRAVPDGLWSLKDPGPSGVVHGPQRKGRGGKIKRW